MPISFVPPTPKINGMAGSGLANTGVQSPFTTFQAQAPQLPQFDAMGGMQGAMGNDAQARAQQMQFLQALQGQANGSGPSVAQNLLGQGIDRNNAGAASMMAGARGMNPGLAAKMAMDQMGQNNQAGAQSSALLRSQEMLANQGMMGGVLQGMRSQDQGQFGQMAQLGLGQNQQTLQGSLGAQGMNEQAQLANLQANMGQNGLNLQERGQNIGVIGSVLGGLGSLGSAFATGGASAAMPTPGIGRGAAHGAMIPGKANTPGDSPKNDTVDIKASPGEIVLPRSVAQADDAPERAAEFVRAIRRKKMSESGDGYGKVLEMRRRYAGGGAVDKPIAVTNETQQVRPSPASPASPDMDIVKMQHMLAVLKAASGK